MSASLEDHPLARDFPELEPALRALNAEDSDVARRLREYASLEREIAHVELGFELSTAEELEALKNRRARLRDMLYRTALRYEATHAATG